MNLLSVNVGLPREIEWKGKIVRTSIFKAPVTGRVRVAKLNVDGDQQADLTVHGGVDKAVYAIIGTLRILAPGTSRRGPPPGSFRREFHNGRFA